MHSPARNGMHPIAGDLGQGLQDEETLVETGMGQVEDRAVDHPAIAGQDQVEVEGPRAPGHGAGTTEGVLDGLKAVEDLVRAEIGVDDPGSVEEGPLPGWPAHGGGLDQGGSLPQVHSPIGDQGLGGSGELGTSIAAVGADGDGELSHAVVPGRVATARTSLSAARTFTSWLPLLPSSSATGARWPP